MKKIFIITLVSVLITSALCGCGKKNTLETEPTAVPTESVTPTVEPTEIVDTTPTIPDDYLVDYPIAIEDKNVYVKVPEGYNNVETSKVGLTTFESEDTENSAYVSYTVNPYYSIEYYKSHTDIGLFEDGLCTIDITEENCDNGITIVRAETIYPHMGSIICYLIEYTLDENNIIQVYIADCENIEAVLDFYRTTENVIAIY